MSEQQRKREVELEIETINQFSADEKWQAQNDLLDYMTYDSNQ